MDELPKYKIGDKFTWNGVSLAVLGVHVIDKDVWYWIERSDGEDGTWIATYREGALSEWEKVEPFFEEGKTYIFPESPSHEYEVRFLARVPGKNFAFAIVNDARAAILDKEYYDRMHEL